MNKWGTLSIETVALRPVIGNCKLKTNKYGKFLEKLWCCVGGCEFVLATLCSLHLQPRRFYFHVLQTRHGQRIKISLKSLTSVLGDSPYHLQPKIRLSGIGHLIYGTCSSILFTGNYKFSTKHIFRALRYPSLTQYII